jgi:collagenase-like PrtC family protease
MPIMEDEHGTYIMNSKDLRAVEHVARLVKIGVDSLKIEGRTKSQYYVTRTAQIYRRAIDDAVAGRPFNPEPDHRARQACPTGATPAASWSAAPCRTTRTTKPAAHTPRTANT